MKDELYTYRIWKIGLLVDAPIHLYSLLLNIMHATTVIDLIRQVSTGSTETGTRGFLSRNI